MTSIFPLASQILWLPLGVPGYSQVTLNPEVSLGSTCQDLQSPGQNVSPGTSVPSGQAVNRVCEADQTGLKHQASTLARDVHLLDLVLRSRTRACWGMGQDSPSLLAFLLPLFQGGTLGQGTHSQQGGAGDMRHVRAE